MTTDPRLAAMTERDLLEAIRGGARQLNVRLYHTHDSRRSSAGFPDLAIAHPPVLLLAELKTLAGRPSAAQRDWLTTLAACDTLAVRLWTPADLDAAYAFLADPLTLVTGHP